MMGKYQTIYADPPWPIKWPSAKVVGTRDLDYPVMSISEIIALDVRGLAARNCSLFLWTTNGFLPEALGVVRHWHFQYELLFTWCKNNGMGGHPRNATEHLIIARRGRPKRGDRHDPMTLNWIALPRTRRHSEKPLEIRKIIEHISPSPRIELFARKRFRGWDAWGDEIDNDTEVPFMWGRNK